MNHHCVRLAASIAIVTFASGCSKSVSDKDVHWLSIDEATELIGENSGSWLSAPKENAWVDPRDVVFYRVGHIPGALNVQLSDPDAISRLGTFGTLIVYGEGYEAPLADAMIKTLIKNGQTEVRGLQLGFEGWKQAGKPIQKGEDAARQAESSNSDRWQRQPVDDE